MNAFQTSDASRTTNAKYISNIKYIRIDDDKLFAFVIYGNIKLLRKPMHENKHCSSSSNQKEHKTARRATCATCILVI